MSDSRRARATACVRVSASSLSIVFFTWALTVSGEDGSFTIKNVPPGTYTIGAWHEKFGDQTAKVTIADGKTENVAFSFKAK